MGEEIDKTNFSPADFRKFSERLKQETDLLRQFFEDGKMSNSEVSFGMELEACLLDSKYKAAPLNNEILASASDIDVSLELAKFNLELNSVPVGKKTNWLRAMHNQLQSNWTAVKKIANNNNCEMAMIGILPTITRDDLTLKNISDMHRYAVLNEEVMNQRTGEPLKISIRGIESLDCINDNVMMEAAATSLQLHLLIPVQQAVRFYNASLIASAATVATAANAPYLFQKLLWADSRIPLFEQAVEVGGFDNVAHGPIRRVSFGTGYARSSLMELFTENLEHFPCATAC